MCQFRKKHQGKATNELCELDSDILDSTLWVDHDASRIFITALLLAFPQEFENDQKGIAVDPFEETGG